MVVVAPPRLPVLRDHRLVILLHSAERRLLEQRARELGLPVSTFARALLLANSGSSVLDANARAPVESAENPQPGSA